MEPSCYVAVALGYPAVAFAASTRNPTPFRHARGVLVTLRDHLVHLDAAHEDEAKVVAGSWLHARRPVQTPYMKLGVALNIRSCACESYAHLLLTNRAGLKGRGRERN